MRRTPLARTPFKRKNSNLSTSLKGAENTPQKQPKSHASKALAAIINVVKNRPNRATSAPALTPVFRGSIPKSPPVRSAAYRRVVASLPCVICGVPGYSQAAHGSDGKGMGIKACDLKTLFPACCDRPGVRGCHSRLDQGALFSKSARHQLEPVWAADTQRKIRAMGLWPKNLPYPSESLDA